MNYASTHTHTKHFMTISLSCTKDRTSVHATCIPWICKHTSITAFPSALVKVPSDGSVHSSHSNASHSNPEKPRRGPLAILDWNVRNMGLNGGFHSHGGTSKLMVYLMENVLKMNDLGVATLGTQWDLGILPLWIQRDRPRGSKVGIWPSEDLDLAKKPTNMAIYCIHQTQRWANQPKLSVIWLESGI